MRKSGLQPRISAAVMAHPDRAAAAGALVHRLRDLGATIAFDPAPELGPSAIRAAALAWGAFDPAATHHLVVQDDVALPEGFSGTLEAAVATQPDRIIALCSDWTSRTGQAARLAAFTGHSWVELADEHVWAPAVLMPVELVRRFLEYIPSHPDERDSGALHEFAKREGIVGITPVPNLAQHDVPWRDSNWTRNVELGPRRSALFLEWVDPEMFTDGAILPRTVLPYLPLSHGACAIGTYGRYGNYSIENAAEWFANRGYSADSLSAAFYGQYQAFAPDELTLSVSIAHAYQVWLTAFAIGYAVLHADVIPTEGSVTESQGVALRTMLAGPMKRFFTLSALEDLVELDANWLVEAMRLGVAARLGGPTVIDGIR